MAGRKPLTQQAKQIAVMLVLGAVLGLGLIAGGSMLGAEIKAVRLDDRYVTVKRLLGKKVKSDLAIWPISYKEAGELR